MILVQSLAERVHDLEIAVWILFVTLFVVVFLVLLYVDTKAGDKHVHDDRYEPKRWKP